MDKKEHGIDPVVLIPKTGIQQPRKCSLTQASSGIAQQNKEALKSVDQHSVPSN